MFVSSDLTNEAYVLINDHLRLQSTPKTDGGGDCLLVRDLGNFLTLIKPNIMDQDHVYLKNYQNVNLDLIWVVKLHNFTLKLPRVYRQRERETLHLSHALVNCSQKLSLLQSHLFSKVCVN